MKNEFSVFEKITLTFGLINFILFVVGASVGGIWENEKLGLILVLPFAFQLVICLILALFVEVILNKIWGLDVHIFPSVFKE